MWEVIEDYEGRQIGIRNKEILDNEGNKVKVVYVNTERAVFLNIDEVDKLIRLLKEAKEEMTYGRSYFDE